MKTKILPVIVGAGLAMLAGCKAIDGSFNFNSSAITGGGAVAGKDYVTGLAPSSAARTYFNKTRSTGNKTVTVRRGDDNDSGVTWTDDGGIVIPPGCSISFKNKGYCMDPHLPAPKAGEEMQFVRTASLLPPRQLATYKVLMQRAADGDEEVQQNMQRLVWALRTAGTKDAMASYLTDRQNELIAEAASECGCYGGEDPFEELIDKALALAKEKAKEKATKWTAVNVGGVSYNAFDLLDPEQGKAKVSTHLQSLVNMSLNSPVSKSGFNYGEVSNGIYTNIKGNGTLSFEATIANSTSEPYTFYPLDYAAQVGSGNSSSSFFAASQGMRQRTTIGRPDVAKINIPPNSNEKVNAENSEAKVKTRLAIIMTDALNKFPRVEGMTQLEAISKDMLLFDATMSTDMYYDVDNNQFKIKDPQILQKILSQDSRYDLDKYNLMHELAHYYQATGLQGSGLYWEMRSSDPASVARAEAFAVLMGQRLSDTSVFRHLNASDSYGHTYNDYVIDYCNRMMTSSILPQSSQEAYRAIKDRLSNGVERESGPLDWLLNISSNGAWMERPYIGARANLDSIPLSDIVKGLRK